MDVAFCIKSLFCEIGNNQTNLLKITSLFFGCPFKYGFFTHLYYMAFYYLIRYWFRLGMWFFYRHRAFNVQSGLALKGPAIIACNHPDSFLDAMFFGACMDNPVYFVTRGDVFEKPMVRKILEALKMIPIFRLRDGKEKLSLNQQTFDAVQEILRQGGIVLIFVEGFCEYQTELQVPLKKGAPRIVAECWQQGINVRVLPTWLRYDSFFDYGKILDINYGVSFGKEITEGIDNVNAQVLQINKLTEKQLLELSAVRNPYKPVSKAVKYLLFPFAMLGKLINLPFYLPIRNLIKSKTKGTTHYDSVLLAALTLLYPFYLLIIASIAVVVFESAWCWLLVLAFPLLARMYLLWKK